MMQIKFSIRNTNSPTFTFFFFNRQKKCYYILLTLQINYFYVHVSDFIIIIEM
jgi:hypothetical protein